MNKREKLASAILVLTLAVGTLVDIVGKRTEVAGLEGRADPDTAGITGACEPESALLFGGRARSATAPEDGAGEVAGPEEYRKIDLNKACLEELVLLPGIGPKKAEALLEWRARNGPFKSLESLLEVKGIGPVTLERLRPYASIGD